MTQSSSTPHSGATESQMRGSRRVVMVAGQRTPFGAFGGGLKDVGATELTVAAGRGALLQGGLEARDLDHLILGNVVQSGADAAYSPRHALLKLGGRVEVGALGLNRLCGSGFQAWISAAHLILSGEAEIVLAGGVEQMSQIPYVLRQARFEGYRMGPGQIEDAMTSALFDAYAKMPMAITAENLAERYQISREACDEYSLQTQARYKAALDREFFKTEITPVQVEGRKGTVTVERDEHPKPDATADKLRSMKPLFKENGRVTAATASGIVDGAAVSVLMSEDQAQRRGLKPICRVVSWASVGCDPTIMGIGPAAAIRQALERGGLALNDMSLVEVNEAFAGQYLAVEKELGLRREITNVNGGAIAVGHPLAASGTRIMNHLAYELQRRGGRYGVGSACIGGGQGIAIVIERFA